MNLSIPPVIRSVPVIVVAVTVWLWLLAVPSGVQAQGCTVSWAVDEDGFWDVPDNWSTGSVPGYLDEVCIARDADLTVTVRAFTARVGLQSSNTVRVVTGGDLFLANASTLSGALIFEDGRIDTVTSLSLRGDTQWHGGTFRSNGIVTNHGTMTLSGEALKTLNLLDNQGVINHGGTGALALAAAGSVLNNLAGGIYDFQADVGIEGNGRFNNYGVVLKSTGTGVSSLSLSNGFYFNNLNGIVNVRSGQLSLARGDSTGGDYRVASGAVLDLTGGSKSADYEGLLTGSGDGRVEVSSGRLNIATEGATLDFPEGMFHWTGGEIWTEANGLTNEGYLTLSGPESKVLEGTFYNVGHLLQTDASAFDAVSGYSPDLVVNLGSGRFEIQGDLSVDVEFDNQGAVVKTGSSGESTFLRSFNNQDGSIAVHSGRLDLAGGGTGTGGSFSVEAGAALELSATGGHRMSLGGYYTGSGGGIVELSGGLSGDTDNPPELDFPEGMLLWTGSDTLVGTFVNSGHLTTSGDLLKDLRGTLANTGTISYQGTGDLQMHFGSVLSNEGVLDLMTDADITWGYSPNASIINTGLFRKSGGVGTSVVLDSLGAFNPSLTFDNQGTVKVETGTLSFAWDLEQVQGEILEGGTWEVEAFATLEMSHEGDILVNRGQVLLNGPGAGFLNLNNLHTNEGVLRLGKGRDLTTAGDFANSGNLTLGGTLSVNGDFAQSGSETLRIEVAGPPASGDFGRLEVSGQADLEGTVEVGLTEGFGPTSGDSYQVAVFAERVGALPELQGLHPYFEANVLDQEIRLDALVSAADLDVDESGFSVSGSGIPGETIDVTYRVQNLSSNGTALDWTDSLYLSGDDTFDPADSLIARVPHSGGVDGLSSYTESVSAPLPGVMGGSDYRVILIADSRGLSADVDRDNNDGAAPDPFEVRIPELGYDAGEAGTITEGQAIYYRLEVPAGGDVLLEAELGQPRGAELYASFQALPDRSSHDFLASGSEGTSLRLLLSSPEAGDYYLLLSGREGAAVGTDYEILAQHIPFALLTATPDYGGSGERVTVSVDGAGFTDTTQARLELADGTLAAVADVQQANGNRLLAAFDLLGVAAGIYDFVVQQDAMEEKLPGGFEVVAGTEGLLDTNFALPSVRNRRPFSGRLDYGNAGSGDLPVPLFVLNAPSSGSIWFPEQSEHLAGSFIQALGLPHEGVSGGVIPPGQGDALGFRGMVTSIDDRTFSLQTISGDAPEPFDFENLRASLKPDTATPRWDQAFDAMVADIGGSAGDYVQALTRASDEAYGFGLPPQRVDDLLHYMLDRQFVGMPEAELHGALLDESANPVAGKTIYLVTKDSVDAFATTSWHDGRFAFHEVPGGDYLLSVEEMLVVSGSAQTVPNATPVDLVVTAGAELSGRVLSLETAAPIDQASLAVTNLETGESFTATTDGDGNYRLKGLPDDSYLARASADGHLGSPSEMLVLAENSPTVFNLQLEHGTAVAGRVVTPEGAPVEGASVLAVPVDAETNTPVQRTVSGSDGGFEFTGLESREHELIATASGFGAGVMEILVLKSSVSKQVGDLPLTSPGSIRGTVSSAGDVVLPLEGAVVQSSAYENSSPQTTDAAGQYRLDDLPPGSLELEIIADGYDTESISLDLAEGSALVQDVVLQRAGEVLVTLTDGEGRPLAGVEVSVLTPFTSVIFTSTTDANGQIFLDGLPHGDYLFTVGSGFASVIDAQTVTLDQDTGQLPLDIAIDTVELRGNVLRSGGGAPAGPATIALIRDGEVVDLLTTSDDGEYRLLVLEEGTYRVIAMGDDVGIVDSGDLMLQFADGKVTRDLTGGDAELRLTASSSASGLPAVQDAVVNLSSPAYESLPAFVSRLTDAAGEAVFSNLLPGDYRVTILADGVAATVLDLSVPAEGLSQPVDLAEGRVIRGTVSDEALDPLMAAQVTAIATASGIPFITRTDQDGQYRFTGLPAGRFDLWAGDDLNRPAVVRDVDLESATERDVDLVLTRNGAMASGTVLSADGRAVAWASVALVDDAGQALISALSNENGVFELGPLPAGEHRLGVFATGYGFATRTLTIPDAGEVTVDFVLEHPRVLAIEPSVGVPFQPMAIAAGAATAPSGPPPSTSELANQFLESWFGNLRKPDETDVHKALRDKLHAISDSIADSAQFARDCPEAWAAWILAVYATNTAELWNAYLIGEHFNLVSHKAILGAQAAAQAADIYLQMYLMLQAGAGVEAAQFAQTFSGIAGAASSVQQQLMFGKFDLVGESFNTLGNILYLARNQDWATAGEGAAGTITSFLSLAWKIYNTAKDVFISMPGELKAMMDSYNQSWVYYLNSVDALQRAVTDLVDALKDCDPCKKENPPAYCDPCKQEPPPEYCNPTEQGSVGWAFASDPNDILGPKGYGPEHYIQSRWDFLYTILFENKPEANAPAQEVVITQQLDDNLDWNSFQLGNFSFGEIDVMVPAALDYYASRLDMRDSLGFFVDFEAELDKSTGMASWRLIAIDPETGDLISDPLAGFLPPNLVPPEGEGSVLYSIRPKSGLPTGTTIEAQASIRFDVETPIQTAVYVNRLDDGAPTSSVDTLPAVTNNTGILVSWSGTDGADGSGIASYSVYVQQDGGAFNEWLLDTGETQAIYSGQPGHSYGFYSRAVDNVGNEEPDRAAADTATLVDLGVPIGLVRGFNLMSGPADTTTIPDAFSLMALIDPEGTKLVALMRYDKTAAIVRKAFYDQDGEPMGDNFPLIPGEGLVAVTGQDLTFELNPGDCPSFDLKKGVNWVGTPCDPIPGSAFGLLNALGGETVVSSIQRFNPQQGRFEAAAISSGGTIGFDFPLEAGEAFILHMHQDQLFEH